MKSTLILLGVAAGAVAQPHNHQHRRSHHHHLHELEKRAVFEELVTVTVLECVLDGSKLSEKECKDGIDSGRLRYIDGGNVEYNSVSVDRVKKPAPAVHAEGAAPVPTPKPALAPVPPPAAAAPPPAAAPAKVETNNRVSSGSSGFSSANGNAGKSFPSGQLSCNQFPSDFGAVPVNYLGLGGWLSIQTPRVHLKRTPGFDNIMTTVPNMCSGPDCCSEGAYCSYACPAGYFKAQWPTTQGQTGQSVGGLLCQGGKLVLTNPEHDTLCVKGAKQVKAYIENKLDQVVSLCQTNYPGDEAMTVPTVVQPGARVEIPILDSNSYWKTVKGEATSAQFYLNPAGVGPEQACVWSSSENKNVGNWAPMIIGSGWYGNEAFMSLFGNRPTTHSYLNYKVTTTGDGSIPCKYENQQVCMYAGYGTCNDALSANGGCTIGLRPGGTINYVLHN